MEYAFLTSVSILSASVLIVLFGILQFSMHKNFGVVCFFSESNAFENSGMKLTQSDLLSIGKTENQFWAAPSNVVWIRDVHLCIQFDEVEYLLIQVYIQNQICCDCIQIIFY